MLEKDFGFAKIVVTDSQFGPVQPGDTSFPSRFEKHFGYEPESIVWMNQVHSPHVLDVEDQDDRMLVLPETDGVLTNKKGQMLITKTADCVPILLWSQEEGYIAALHAGWRGFLAGIIEHFVQVCQKRKLDLGSFSAFLGPHLRVENFEVRQDFIDQLPEEKKSFLKELNGSIFFDITEAVLAELQHFGIKDVQDSGINTYNNADYFSYRSWTHLPEDQRPESYSTFANCILIS